MTFFVIQQVSTGLFLPAGGKHLKGHTAQKPTNDRPPRLFKSEINAKRALHCYIQGRWKESYTTSYDGEPDYSGPEPDWKTKRDIQDFKVTKIEMSIK